MMISKYKDKISDHITFIFNDDDEVDLVLLTNLTQYSKYREFFKSKNINISVSRGNSLL